VQFAATIALVVGIGAGFVADGGSGRLHELVAIGAFVVAGYLIGSPLNGVVAIAAAGAFVIFEGAYGRLDSAHAISGTCYAVATAAAVVFAGYLRPPQPPAALDRGVSPLQLRPAPGSLEYELQRSLRHEHAFALMVARPDDLPERARYGPYGLERILDRVAATIAEQLRASDVARRRGRHDFWLILPETTGEAARVVAERIRLALGARELELGPGKLTRLSVSIGIACFPDDGGASADLLVAAERALHHALQLGGNRTVLHSLPGHAPRGWGLDGRDGDLGA
jgi:diguanylate cyclase (GGDEF)-like protein